MAVQDEDPTLGRIGGYKLLRRLATGGTSDVLLARAEGPHGFERTVVLKRLLSEHRQDPDFARMFTQEASAYARLSHPAVVRLFDFFTKDSQLIMVIEYVDGVALSRLMTTLHQRGQRLDTGSCLFIASRLFDALAAAHEARNPETGDLTPVIHRDVNPSNILLPWDGFAKLADFGIAKITGGASESGEVETVTGFIKGTFGYMAPEQVTGERVTIRTDVYAATLVLWELLSHRKAIQTDKLPEMEVLRAMAEPKLPSLDVLRPDLPDTLREAIRRGLEPNAARRSITAEEMASILRDHMDPAEAQQKLANALETLRPRGKDELEQTVVRDLAETTTDEILGADFAEVTEREPEDTARKRAPAVLAQTGTGPTVVGPKVQTPSGFRPVHGPPSPPPPPPVPSIPAEAVTMPRSVDPLLQQEMMSRSSSEFPTAVSPAPAPRPPPPQLQRTLAAPLAPAGMPPSRPQPAVLGPELGQPPPPPPLAPPPPRAQGFGGTLVMDPPATPLGPPPAPPVRPMTPSLSGMGTSPYPFGPLEQPPSLEARREMPTGPAMMPLAPLQPMPRVASQQKGGGFGWLIGVLVGLLVAGGLALGAAFLVYRSRATVPSPVSTVAATPATTTTAKPTATATAKPTATASASATTIASSGAVSPSARPTATTSAIPTATATAVPSVGSSEGAVVLPASAEGHRVWVDGKVKNNGQSPIVLACGKHTVQIGSAGAVQDVDVPCGGQVEVR